MIKRTVVTLFSVCAMISFILRHLEHISYYKEDIFTFIIFIFPYILMNSVACYFLVLSMLKKPRDVNENIWVVIASFLGCNLTLIVGHFFELKATNINENVALIGSILGILIIPFYIVAVINLGKSLTILPEANKLNTKGIYSFSRHPLYSSYLLWYFASILMFQSIAIVIASIIQAIFQVIRAKNEEKILEKNFPEYADYKKRVWWIGKVKGEMG